MLGEVFVNYTQITNTGLAAVFVTRHTLPSTALRRSMGKKSSKGKGKDKKLKRALELEKQKARQATITACNFTAEGEEFNFLTGFEAFAK